MVRRGLFGPVLVLAIFVVAVCAVTLAHAERAETDTCTAVKVASESAATSPADLTGPLIGSLDLRQPSSVVTGAVPDRSAGASREVLAGPLVPRAPPA